MTESVDATSDDRTLNNTLRHQYRVLSDDEKLLMQDIKDTGLAFLSVLGSLPDSREKSLAYTKLEEAVMWAIKGLTK